MSPFHRTVSTLGRPEQLPFIPYGKRPKTLPTVLSPEEVLRLLDAATPPRDRVLLQVAYGCGLHLNELLHLRDTDIDRFFCPGRCDTARRRSRMTRVQTTAVFRHRLLSAVAARRQVRSDF